MASSTRTQPVARRSGRPTAEEAARLDETVREHALERFLEQGYEGTTMDAIARAAGTTKVSLYARFPSKEALFRAVFEWAVRRPDWPAAEPAAPDVADLEDLETALRSIADAGLRRALDPSMVRLGQVAVAEAARFPDLARLTHVASWARRDVVVDVLRRHAGAGAIVADEPEILAEHFIAMVAGMPARLASFGIVRDADEQAHYTEVAVQLFVRGLRPE